MKDGPGSSNASSAFDEHERDTAKRAYPKEVVGATRSTDAQATRKIPKMDLEAVLRNESGTRPAVSREEIERFTRERLAQQAAEVGADIEVDPHSRPTIDATPPFFALGVPDRKTAPLVTIDRPSPIEPAPSSEARPSEARPAPKTTLRLPRGGATILVLGLIVLIAAWTTIGFLLGRYLPH